MYYILSSINFDRIDHLEARNCFVILLLRMGLNSEMLSMHDLHVSCANTKWAVLCCQMESINDDNDQGLLLA